jgi:hypothetical protein
MSVCSWTVACSGPLIIEEREAHVAYDREYTLVFDDYLPGAPVPVEQVRPPVARGREAA